MKRLIISILLLFGGCYGSFAQETSVKQHIKESLSEFMAAISGVNDSESKENVNSIVKEFTTSNYFQFNSEDVDAVSFFNKYCSEYLQGKIISHHVEGVELRLEDNMCWSISCILVRERADGVQSHIRDTNLQLLVRCSSIKEPIKILSMSFYPQITMKQETHDKEYVFKILESEGLRQDYRGRRWNLSVDSRVRDVHKLDGKIYKLGEYYRIPFKVSANVKVDTTKIGEGIISGYLPQNNTRFDKRYNLKLSQVGSSQECMRTIYQEKKPSFFDFDSDDAAMHQVDVIYSLKYNVGLSYMITIPDSRFSVGAAIASNFNSFRGLAQGKSSEPIKIEANNNVNVDINIGGGDASVSVGTSDDYSSDITNGYRKSVVEYKAKDSQYSSIMDPDNLAEHFKSRSYFLAQGGVYLCQWVRFDLGLGAARCQDVHYMKEAYDVTKYSYEAIEDNLTQIDDVYVYKRAGCNYFRDKTKWSFAIRPAINAQIPLSYSAYLTLGVGYLYTPTLFKSSSVDFSIGFGWNLY